MRFYAERPARLARQLLADVLVLGWTALCVVVALTAHDLVLRLQGPARTLTGAGDAIRGAFDNAAQTAGEVPFVGAALANALGTGTGAGDSLASAGRQQLELISSAAFWIAVAIVLVGALPVLLVWLVVRARYALAARSAIRVRSVDTDLLAMRALAHVPVRRLLAVAPDPAAAWRRDERDVVHGLAELELRSLGLRAPVAPPD